jgi:hypothetical protein
MPQLQQIATNPDAFFKLKGNAVPINSQTEFLDHLKISNHLKDTIYFPDNLIWTSNKAVGPQRYSVTGVTFENVSFAKTKIKNFGFVNCKFIDCLFMGSSWDDVEFHGCSFTHCNMHKISISNTYVDPRSFKNCLDHRRYSNIGVHLFQQLLRNFSETEQPLFRDDAKFFFLRWRRWNLYSKLRQWRTGRVQSESAQDMARAALFSLLYEKLLGSGIRVRYVLATTVVAYLLAALANYLFWMPAGLADHGKMVGPTVVNVFYFTATMLSTTGPGDIVPTASFGRIMVGIEALFGVLWFAILASMIFRKITR